MVPAYLFSAVLYGTFFALMAMGLTLTYLTTKVPNFAYGSFVTIGLYVAYQLDTLNHLSPYYSSLIAFLVGGAASVLMYIGILRPLAKRGTPLVGQMIATFGIDIGFIGIFGIYTDFLQSKYKLVDAKQFYFLPGDFTVTLPGSPPQQIGGVVLVAPIVLALITLGIYLLFTRTKFGIAMRASVENASLAKILGINVERVYVTSWMLAGGFAGLAGALYTLALPGGTSTGSDLIVEIFASSVLGGLSSIFGAVVGGLVIGGSEDVVTSVLSSGLGYIGTALVAAFLIVLGAVIIQRRLRRPGPRIGDAEMGQADVINRKAWVPGRSAAAAGVFFIVLGAYMVLEMATGFSTDLFVAGLVNGFQSAVIPFQKGIPLLIMVISLLVLPQGLVSLKIRNLRRSRT